jgi:hypothetical protein
MLLVSKVFGSCAGQSKHLEMQHMGHVRTFLWRERECLNKFRLNGITALAYIPLFQTVPVGGVPLVNDI